MKHHETKEKNGSKMYLGYPALNERHVFANVLVMILGIVLFLILVNMRGWVSLGFAISAIVVYWVLLMIFTEMFPACKLKMKKEDGEYVSHGCKSKNAQQEIQTARDIFYATYVALLFMLFFIFKKPYMVVPKQRTAPASTSGKRSTRRKRSKRRA